MNNIGKLFNTIWFKVLMLGVFAISITLFYGRIGLMAVDQSIIFDGAWRIYIGQVPYKDFFTPTGVVVMILQALFFKLMGVSWFSYCFHAGVFNFLFCLVVWRLLFISNVPSGLSFLYAFLSGVVFYPPFGTAYMDQHSMFFTVAYIWLFVEAAKTKNNRVCQICLMLVPMVFTIGFFSKQIPAVFGLPLIVCLWWVLFEERRLKSLIWIIGGALSTVLLFALIIFIAKINFSEMFYFLIKLPMSMGGDREGYVKFFKLKMILFTAFLPFLIILFYYARSMLESKWSVYKVLFVIFVFLTSFVLFVWWTTSIFKFVADVRILLAVYGIFFITFFYLLIKNWVPDRIQQLFRETVSVFPLLIAGYGVFYISWMFINKTLNNFENGFGMMFIVLGLLHAVFIQLFKPFRVGTRGVVIFLSLISIMIAVLFNQRANVTRAVHEYRYENTLTKIAEDRLEGPLNFIHWVYGSIKSDKNVYKRLEIMDSFFREHPGNFLYLGELIMIYAQTGRPSILPVIWLHEGLTVPKRGTPEHKILENKFDNFIKKYDVQYIVHDPESFLGFSPFGHFRTMHTLMYEGKKELFEHGIEIYKIDHTKVN